MVLGTEVKEVVEEMENLLWVLIQFQMVVTVDLVVTLDLVVTAALQTVTAAPADLQAMEGLLMAEAVETDVKQIVQCMKESLWEVTAAKVVLVALAVPAAQPMEDLTEYLDKEAIQVIAVLMEQLLLALRMGEAAALVLLE